MTVTINARTIARTASVIFLALLLAGGAKGVMAELPDPCEQLTWGGLALTVWGLSGIWALGYLSSGKK